MATNRRSSDHHHPHQQNQRDQNESTLAVVMVPLPAQGHLNQLLHLSRLIAAHNIPIHYVCTATHIHQAKHRIHGWDPRAATNLHFHEFPIPEFESSSLNPNATNKFPSHLQPLFEAAAHLRQPLTAFLRSLSHTSHRVVVIHDSLMSSVVQDVVSIPNAESYIFHSISAFAIFLYFWEELGKPFPIDEELLQEIPSLEDCFTTEFMDFIVSEENYIGLCSGSLYNASRVVEGKYINLLEKMSEHENKKHWAIGPFNPVEMTEKKPDELRHECLRWLDKQEPKSVVFISFGTTTSLPDEQIKQLAMGLEESKVKFIWVLRDADRADFNTENDHEMRKNELPTGFEDGVKEGGIIVRNWAPQLEILGHYATGGFLSHCGWNSCMESISMGVPIAAWPMHSDQPRNAVLMTKVLKIGIVVKDWGRRGEIVTSITISGALKRLMGSEEGEQIRRRAEELGGAVRKAMLEGGATRMEMDSFVAHISR
ncbi:UDP-glucuronosyl and UDP-glucosyl transferase [Handroanthus impetiginosus]|uniref:Glycosyltransferase n=1 Tax=Handroanthus impetiginosus TaxID=429701 RepID=A0A2G9HFJ1_9LAMI|nr:UDP-glucuronosyl and UDP-glucosyl transferase [Handroanthus impetiginosus]